MTDLRAQLRHDVAGAILAKLPARDPHKLTPCERAQLGRELATAAMECMEHAGASRLADAVDNAAEAIRTAGEIDIASACHRQGRRRMLAGYTEAAKLAARHLGSPEGAALAKFKDAGCTYLGKAVGARPWETKGARPVANVVKLERNKAGKPPTLRVTIKPAEGVTPDDLVRMLQAGEAAFGPQPRAELDQVDDPPKLDPKLDRMWLDLVDNAEGLGLVEAADAEDMRGMVSAELRDKLMAAGDNGDGTYSVGAALRAILDADPQPILEETDADPLAPVAGALGVDLGELTEQLRHVSYADRLPGIPWADLVAEAERRGIITPELAARLVELQGPELEGGTP